MKNYLSLLAVLSMCAHSSYANNQNRPGPTRANCSSSCSCCPCNCSSSCSCCPLNCSYSCSCKKQTATPLTTQLEKKVSEKRTAQEIKDMVKTAYAKVAESNGACSCVGGCCGGGTDLSKYLGYSDEELAAVPEANLGLGCGNPIALGKIEKGSVVLDLGSGAGIDCLLAARKVGPTGKIIGVDMTDAMLKKAKSNAKKYGFTNVEFRKGDIEHLPVESNSVNIILSNCVINLAPDKLKVFNEAYRVLKSKGKMYVSDIVLLAELTPKQRKNSNLICSCIGGALLKEDYINKLNKAGFIIQIIGEDKEIGKKWFPNQNLPISSLKFIAYKQ